MMAGASFWKIAPISCAAAWLMMAASVQAAGPAVSAAQGARTADKTAAENSIGGLMPHRATYEMTLTKVSQSDGVRAASGIMTYTLTDRCDGYTIETVLSLHLAFANGNENQIEQRYVAWEAKNGKSSTFRFQVLENGSMAKAYHGSIQFNDDGKGTATYQPSDGSRGDVATFDLQPGTLLSTAHTLSLLKSAEAREKFVSKLVIDGSFDQGPFLVTAAIAPPHEGGIAPVKDGSAVLGDGRYWPMGLAYFPVASDETMPEYEISQNLLGTGVTRSMMQDFGGFTLAFTPVKMEPVNTPPC